jgi:hypothetical protein
MTDEPAEDDLYDLAPPDVPPAASGRRVPAAASPYPPQPPDPTRPAPLAYHTPPTASSPKIDEQTLKNQHIPIALLGGGVVIEVTAAFLIRDSLDAALKYVDFQLVAGTIFMLVGIMLAAKLRGIELGRFWTVVLKLSAISVAPAAMVRLATPLWYLIPFGGILGWIAEFILYFALLGMLFDLDESDTWYCVLVIFLVRLGVYFLILWLL